MEGKMEEKKRDSTTRMLRNEGRSPSGWLRRTASVVVISTAASLVGGCMTPSMMAGAPGVVPVEQQEAVGTVFNGVVTNLQPIKIRDVNPASGYGYGYIAPAAGALLGAEAGLVASQHAKSYIVQDIAESTGGIAGALIGEAIQQRINTAPGCQITVEVNSNIQNQPNKLVAIAQQANGYCKSFSNGEKVDIDVFGGRARVVPSATQ